MDKEKNKPEQWNEAYHFSLVHGLLHEIGHPLTSIRMHISNIIEGRIPPDEINKRLIAIDEMAKNMEMELRNFRVLSEITRSKVKSYESRNVSVKNLIFTLIGNFRLQAKSKGLTIRVEHSEDFIVNTDATILSQILWNLIDNAIKYSYSTDKRVQNPEILIRYKLAEDYAIFEIINWGIPVPDEEAEKIFEMNYRGQNAMKISPTGLGIGLFVAQKCVEAIDSEIRIKSDDNKTTATLKVRRSLA
jgi:signal transduction histidine kinase